MDKKWECFYDKSKNRTKEINAVNPTTPPLESPSGKCLPIYL
jgi:hypothetical protein